MMRKSFRADRKNKKDRIRKLEGGEETCENFIRGFPVRCFWQCCCV